LELFLRDGYDATTVAAIARAAGVSHMTFFRHFPTKESVVLDDPYDPVTGPHSLLRALVGCSCKGLGGSRETAWRGRRLTATMTPPLPVLPRPWNRQQRDAP
jgi:AcrR family transcriptional regulator